MKFHVVLVLVFLLFCWGANANPLFYRNIDYVDYFDITSEFIFYDSNDRTISREDQGVVYDSKGHKIGTYTTDSQELFEDRTYYDNTGKRLGSCHFLYFNASLAAKLTYYDSSKKRIGTFSFKWSLSKVVDFFLEGNQLRLTHD